MQTTLVLYRATLPHLQYTYNIEVFVLSFVDKPHQWDYSNQQVVWVY